MCSSPVLEVPDFQKPFILQTDASERGVGAVRSQKNALGQEHPVSYFSHKLLPREAKYSTVEKECLAIKLAVQAFRVPGTALHNPDRPSVIGVAGQV